MLSSAGLQVEHRHSDGPPGWDEDAARRLWHSHAGRRAQAGCAEESRRGARLLPAQARRHHQHAHVIDVDGLGPGVVMLMCVCVVVAEKQQPD